jgi:hypothetical protein
LLGVVLFVLPNLSLAQTLATREQAGNVLTVDKVMVQDGTLTGEIRNQTKNTIRDVQLFIRYNWLWADERHPGKDSPSAAFYPTIAGEIAPGGSLPFKFTPSPPLANRTDGRFETPSVSIAGFAQVYFPSK